MRIYRIIFISLFLFGCASENSEKTKNSDEQSIGQGNEDQLNITILLDLSDRIDPELHPVNPEHFERDMAIVKYFSELFVKDMERRGTFMAKGKMKVVFSPRPQDPNVNLLAERLSVDLANMDNKQKKEVHDSIIGNFSESIRKIYSGALLERKWLGSDVWRFFKNDVKDYCVEEKPNYRNILVILTDGYIFHEDSKTQEGNRYSYLLPSIISKHNLRNNPNWNEEVNKEDFGLIAKRNDLENLEVLVLEVSPSGNYKDDEDIIKSVLTKWFKEMNVKRFGIYYSDLPEYTKQRIDDFIK